MHLRLATLHVIITTCRGLANYNLFRGFTELGDDDTANLTSPTTTFDELISILINAAAELATSQNPGGISNHKTTTGALTSTPTSVFSTPLAKSVATVFAKNSSKGGTTHSAKTTKSAPSRPTTMVPTTQPPFADKHTILARNFNCPEEERPSNIGAYEIPTQRDLVLITRNTLLRMFDRYHKKTLIFLADIKEVMRSTAGEERKCVGDRKALYRQCVRQVSREFERHTKKLVNYLEQQRKEVMTFTEGTVCKMADMPADPVQLMRSIAAEEVSLQYALPGLLRLLSTCSMTWAVRHKTKTWKPDQDQEHFGEHFRTKTMTKAAYQNRHKILNGFKSRHKILK